MSHNAFDYVHVGLFTAVGSAALAVGLLSKCARVRKVATGNALPLFISAITYLVLVELPKQPELRWLGYTLACTLFAYETSLVQGRADGRALWAGGFMGATLFTGYLGYLFSGAPLTLVFILGCVTYLGSLLLLALPERGEAPVAWRKYKLVYLFYFIGVWSIYPLVYALGPAFWEVISRESEEIGYFVLEFFAKYSVAALNIALVSPLLDKMAEKGWIKPDKAVEKKARQAVRKV